MSPSPVTPAAYAGTNGRPSSYIGVSPDFHHLPHNSTAALESYMRFYVESSSLAEASLRSSIRRLPS